MGPSLLAPSSSRQQAVLADHLICELARDFAFAHHHDTVGEREDRFGFGGKYDDRDALLAQGAYDLYDVLLGAHIHSTSRLHEQQHPRRVGEPFSKRNLLLIAAG